MEKKLIQEINEIRSMMGLSLISEQGVVGALDDIAKKMVQVAGKTVDEEIAIGVGKSVKKIKWGELASHMRNYKNLTADNKKLVQDFLKSKAGKSWYANYKSEVSKLTNATQKGMHNRIINKMESDMPSLVGGSVSGTQSAASSKASSAGSISNKSQSTINSELEKKLELALKQKATFENFWVVYQQQLKASGVSWLRRPFVKNTLETVYKRSPESLNKMADDLLGVFQQTLLNKKLKSANSTAATKLITLMKTVMASIGAAGAVLLLVGLIGLVTGQVTLAEMIEFINDRITPKETAKELVKTVKDVVVGGIEGATETTPVETPANTQQPNNPPNPPNNTPNPPNNKEKKSSDDDNKSSGDTDLTIDDF
jgi:hypothetical protein